MLNVDDHRGPPADADDEIDLEPLPSEGSDEPQPASGYQSAAEEPDDQATPVVSSEFTALLRSRLRAAAGFIAVAFLAFLAFELSNPDRFQRTASIVMALHTTVAVVVCGLLFSRLPFSYLQLRVVEYAFFGTEMLLLLYAQYTIDIRLAELADAHSTLAMVAFEKNGVLRTIILMMIYGVFIPNDPKVTMRVVMTMAAGPIVVLAVVLQHGLDLNTITDDIVSSQNIVANAMFLVIGASLAMFSAHVIQGMRMQLQNAQQIGQYKLLYKLGSGGMGDVYLAEHQLLKRPCVIKLISADYKENTFALARFEREVQAAATLTHPNTIGIYDYGHTDDGIFYYVMEYLPGMSLAEFVREAGPLPPGRAVYLMRQVCGSLAEAHRLGLVHRDIKPANIHITILGGRCDVAKVLDFGLVKVENPRDGLQNITAQFTVSGTPTFMSPEQARGISNVDGRTDLYSLGAILYFMLTGKPPFERDSPMALMFAHAGEAAIPPSQIQAGIPADLEAVVMRCLEKSPAERFPLARDMSAALAACECAHDWDESDAEQWWIEHAASHMQKEEAMRTGAIWAI